MHSGSTFHDDDPSHLPLQHTATTLLLAPDIKGAASTVEFFDNLQVGKFGSVTLAHLATDAVQAVYRSCHLHQSASLS